MKQVEEKMNELKFLIENTRKELSTERFGTRKYFELASKLDDYLELQIAFNRIIKRKPNGLAKQD